LSHVQQPGLARRERIVVRRERLLPVPGEVAVSPGQQLASADEVGRAERPGALLPVDVARALDIRPQEVPAAMLKREGEPVRSGEVLARVQRLFGWLTSECRAPVDGTIAGVSRLTGQVLLAGPPARLSLAAWLAGQVVQVVPQRGAVVAAEATWIQGIFGLGGECWGALDVRSGEPGEELTAAHLTDAQRGRVVVGGGRAVAEALVAADRLGVAAVVAGSVNAADLEAFGSLSAPAGSRPGPTLIITEGFGSVPMAAAAFELLRRRNGAPASVTGATRIRAGVQRPEILVPWPAGAWQDGPMPAQEEGELMAAGALALGQRVRLVGAEDFGRQGVVRELPSLPRITPAEVWALVAVVELAGGQLCTVPCANLERLW